jgi:hypothetical protein
MYQLPAQFPARSKHKFHSFQQIHHNLPQFSTTN